MPSVPGTPVVGSPDAVVAAKRLPPSASSPAGFWNVASSIVPSCCGAGWPAMLTDTTPSFEMLTDVALAGMVISGWSGMPSAVSRRPSASGWNAPARV